MKKGLLYYHWSEADAPAEPAAMLQPPSRSGLPRVPLNKASYTEVLSATDSCGAPAVSVFTPIHNKKVKAAKKKMTR